MLITGGGGQLGSALAGLLGEEAVALPHERLDITDRALVASALSQTVPDVVVNCAAFHNLQSCEDDPQRAWAVNVEAVRILASHGVRLVHVSTNYVFDGAQDRPYSEHDVTSPRSAYAISKLAGEHVALGYGEHSLIVRTAGLYGLQGSASKGGNFVTRILTRARGVGSLDVVADQRLSPTFTLDLAEAIVAAIRSQATGIVHLTASGDCSWYEFTQAILTNAALDARLTETATPTGRAEPARPRNGVLARPRADALGLPRLRHWRAALDDYMARADLIGGCSTTSRGWR